MGIPTRALNEGRCERLLDRSGLLDTEGIHWAKVGSVAVEPGVLTTLTYMRDVEAFTNRYLSGLVAHPATLGDHLIRRFLHIWQAEEAAHARALDTYLRSYGERRGIEVPDVQPAPPASSSERWLVALTKPIGHVVTAAHMTWGAANELLTMTGYRLLAGRCGDPILADLLRRIAMQESRHYAFYRLQAEWRLSRSALARRVLPALMNRAWTPVGVGDGFKSAEEFDRVLVFLAADGEGATAIDAMDGAMRRLPGLQDTKIFARAAALSRSRCAYQSEAKASWAHVQEDVAPLERAS